VIPYADFTYFGVLLYAIVPTVVFGLFGRANSRWALLVTVVVVAIQYQDKTRIAGVDVPTIWIVICFGCWQWMIVRVYAALRARGGLAFFATILLSLLPLFLTKVRPVAGSIPEFGFIGISYVTFRVLDLIFCLRDNVIVAPQLFEFLAFLFFFPTISAGPIDRYRRFLVDWKKTRTRMDFVIDLDGAVHRLFRGFLYKFIIAALIKKFWLDPAATSTAYLGLLSYMYAYSLHLFFDFAGYSAFAIAFSYLLGIHTPENFNRPFLARNIRDFWNRWHITLSFWFRDHVYMRFIFAAMRNHWTSNRDVVAITGYFLTFGLMGLWHGIQLHFLLYGLYQAVLLSSFHLFSEWRKNHTARTDHPVRHFVSVFATFHLVCFGFLIFSGRLDSFGK